MTKRGRQERASKVSRQSNSLKIVICLAVLLAGFGFWRYAGRSVQGTRTAASVVTAEGPSAGNSNFAPTVENKNDPACSGPEGMAWIPGSEFSMGAQDRPGNAAVGMQATLDSRPIHRVYVDGFWM